jgi:glycosyltransferase involved in cell wall biosynthesis
MVRASSTNGNATVVFLIAVVEWGFNWQSSQTIAKGLAERGFVVHYLNPIPKRFPGLREIPRVMARLGGRPSVPMGRPVPAGVTVWNPRCIPSTGPVTRAFAHLMLRPLLARLRRIRSHYGRCVVVNCLPFRLPHQVAMELEPDLLAYLCHTHWEADPHAPSGELCEEEVLRTADLVLADSDLLYERCRDHPGVRRFPATVDLSLFTPVRRPSHEKAHPSHLRCVYYGGIGWHLDIPLLADLSRRYRLRLVGPVRTGLSALAPDTEVVGVVPHEELPRYLQDADVLILPYASQEFMQGVMPAKLFEYMATGLPIVATDASPTLQSYAPLVHIASSRDAFVRAVGEAMLEEPTLRDQRLALARENSVDLWMDRLATWLRSGL